MLLRKRQGLKKSIRSLCARVVLNVQKKEDELVWLVGWGVRVKGWV